MAVKMTARQYADAHGIDVDYFPMRVLSAMSIEEDGLRAIAINPDRVTSVADENVKIGHELGHCEYGGFYSELTPLYIREKHEYKANAWAVQLLVPFVALREAVHEGLHTTWELAEHFTVTESFMALALEYYTERKGLSLA